VQIDYADNNDFLRKEKIEQQKREEERKRKLEEEREAARRAREHQSSSGIGLASQNEVISAFENNLEEDGEGDGEGDEVDRGGDDDGDNNGDDIEAVRKLRHQDGDRQKDIDSRPSIDADLFESDPPAPTTQPDSHSYNGHSTTIDSNHQSTTINLDPSPSSSHNPNPSSSHPMPQAIHTSL